MEVEGLVCTNLTRMLRAGQFVSILSQKQKSFELVERGDGKDWEGVYVPGLRNEMDKSYRLLGDLMNTRLAAVVFKDCDR